MLRRYVKYSEDEARDESGRWTDGGGTSSSDADSASERIASAASTAPPEHDGQNPCSPKIREIADAYTAQAGIAYDGEARHGEYVAVDVERAHEIAALYDAAENNPHDPEVAAAYQAFKDETHAQYEFLREQGYAIKVNAENAEPYPNSAAFQADVRDNESLTIYPTIGSDTVLDPDNPLLEKTGEIVLDTAGQPYEMTANDEFRWVHDIMGHSMEGNTTGPRGEENAWRQHMSTYSPEAARAMTTETRGQNSWVNFGPGNPGGDTPLADREFAPQKITLLPEWVSTLDGHSPGGGKGRRVFLVKDWNEEDHPRDESGRFGSGGGTTEGNTAETHEYEGGLGERSAVLTPDGQSGFIQRMTSDMNGQLYATVITPGQGLGAGTPFKIEDLRAYPVDRETARPIYNEYGQTQEGRTLVGQFVMDADNKVVGVLSPAEARSVERASIAFGQPFEVGQQVVTTDGRIGTLQSYHPDINATGRGEGTASIRTPDGKVTMDTTAGLQHAGTWETPEGFVAAGVTRDGSAREVMTGPAANDDSGRNYSIEYPAGWNNDLEGPKAADGIQGMRAVLGQSIADNHLIEEDSGLKNAWNGTLQYESQQEGAIASKDFQCSISFDTQLLADVKETGDRYWNTTDGEEARLTMIHEMSHGLSDVGTGDYKSNVGMEEGVVDGYTHAFLGAEYYGTDAPIFTDPNVDLVEQQGSEYAGFTDNPGDEMRVPGEGSVGYPTWREALNGVDMDGKYGSATAAREAGYSWGDRLAYYRDLMQTPVTSRAENMNAELTAKTGYQLTLTGEGIGTKMGYTETLVDPEAWSAAHPGETPATGKTAPTQESVLAGIFSAETKEQAEAALKVAHAWLTAHPDDRRVGFSCEVAIQFVRAHEQYRPSRHEKTLEQEIADLERDMSKAVNAMLARELRARFGGEASKEFDESQHPRDDHGRFGEGTSAPADGEPTPAVADDFHETGSAGDFAKAEFGAYLAANGNAMYHATSAANAEKIATQGLLSAKAQGDALPTDEEWEAIEEEGPYSYDGVFLGSIERAEIFGDTILKIDMTGYEDRLTDFSGLGQYADPEETQAEIVGSIPPDRITVVARDDVPDTVIPASTESKVRPIGGVRVKYSDDEARDDHGRWTDGGSSDDAASTQSGVSDPAALASSAYQSLGATGGATLSTTTNTQPTAGIAVASGGSNETVMRSEAASPEAIEQYIRDNEAALAEPGHYLGVWEDHGYVHLDVSEVVATREEAAAAGEARGEIAGFDLATMEEVPFTTGTGPDNPIVTSSVDIAARELADGKYVDLNQPNGLSTLTDKLAQIAQESQAAGVKAPTIDLGKVTIQGTNLFMAENLGVPRAEMPQFSGVPEPGSPADNEALFPKDERGEVDLSAAYVEHLASLDVDVTTGTTVADNLRATQNELDGVKVADRMTDIENGTITPTDRAIWTTRDDYVLDGHHSWAAAVGVDWTDGKDSPILIGTNQIDMSITDALRDAQEWTQEMGINPRAVGKSRFGARTKYSEDQPRDDHGRFGEGSGSDAAVTRPSFEDMKAGGPSGEFTAATADEAWAKLDADRFDKDAQREAHPENYEPNRGFGDHLKEGATEWRRGVDENGSPIVYQIEAVPWEQMGKDPDERLANMRLTGEVLPMTAGDGTSIGLRVVEGSERPEPYLYRAMSTAELEGAKTNGYIKSNESMNLGNEGTVTSRGSTGSFYAPVDGSEYVIVQLAMDPADGWKVDRDGYVKTESEIPAERITAYSTPLTGREPAASTLDKAFAPIHGGGRVRVKYSEDEERDENGRWTSGGGAGDTPLPSGIAPVPTDVGDLNPQSVVAWQADMDKYGVKIEDLKAELLTKVDQAAIDHATPWYPEAHGLVTDISGKSGIPEDRVAGAMSAMSGRCEWMNAETGEGEVKYLASMAQYVADGKAEGKSTEDAVKDWKAEYKETNDVLAFDDNHERTGDPVGAKIMNSFAEKGMDILTERKTIDEALPENKQRSFFDNIMQPGETREVTCDTHMFKVFENAYDVSFADATKMSGHDVVDKKNGISVNGTGYVALSEAVRDVADQFHTSPDVVQAAYWEVVQSTAHIETADGKDWPSGKPRTEPKE